MTLLSFGCFCQDSEFYFSGIFLIGYWDYMGFPVAGHDIEQGQGSEDNGVYNAPDVSSSRCSGEG